MIYEHDGRLKIGSNETRARPSLRSLVRDPIEEENDASRVLSTFLPSAEGESFARQKPSKLPGSCKR